MPDLPRTFTSGALIFLATCFLLDIYSRIYYFPRQPERHVAFNHATTTQLEACPVQEHMSTIWERNSLLRQKCSLAKYQRNLLPLEESKLLQGFWKFTKRINERKGRECSTSVKFGEFLDYIMKEEVYDPHWQPVSELCGSCRVPYNVISKQETFNNDVRFILNQLSIQGPLKQELLKNLQKKHTENSIKEITPLMIGRAKLDPCLTFMQFCQRSWKSF
uniref:Carbohydrate sulfotransferase n=1 Tax=Magallana gigas TaxID=29159 RepID=A0A8W8JG97_MAGGI